jgi:ketosteroid isomerase-like protein
MSRENVEVVKGIYQSTAHRDWEAVMANYSPDVELDSSVFPGGGVYTGLDGIREWFRQWFGAWEEYRDEVEDYIEAGDHVVVLFAPHGRGKGSQVEIAQRMAAVWTLRDGRVTRLRYFADRAEALRAAGRSG